MQKISCDNLSKIPLTANPDHPIDGALRISVVSGDGTFTQDPATPLSFFAVSGPTPLDSDDPNATAVTVFHVEADGDRGAGESIISDDVELTVTHPKANTLGLTVGAAEPK